MKTDVRKGKGKTKMKKTVLLGITAPLFYYLVLNLLLYVILPTEYNEQYDWLYNALILLLPALPGFAVLIVLIRKTLKEFFVSMLVSTCISLVVIVLYELIGFDWWLHKQITGLDELSLGFGFLCAVTMYSYGCACLGGAVIAGVITLVRQIKAKKNKNGKDSEKAELC